MTLRGEPGVFELTRLRLLALVAEYLRWCAPSAATDMAAAAAVRHMTREGLVVAILIARETGAVRH